MSETPPTGRYAEGRLDPETGAPCFRHTLTHCSRTDPVQLVLPPPQEGLAIYPVRYAVMPHPFEQGRFPTLAFSEYPEADADYCIGLRELRPHAYLYLLYTESGQFRVKRYLVTEDVQFALLRDDGAAENGAQETSGDASIPTRPPVSAPTAFISAPMPTPDRNIGDTVYLLTCDTPLTEAVLDMLASDTDDLRSRTTTAVRLKGGSEQTGVFPTDRLEHLPSLVRQSHQRAEATAWSESQPELMGGHLIHDLCRRGREGPARQHPPVAVALHDPVGIMSEFGHLTGMNVQALQDWAEREQVARKAMVSEWIDILAEQGYAQARSEHEANNPWNMQVSRAATIRNAMLAGEERRANRLASARNDERRVFMGTYQARLQELIDAIGFPAAAANRMYEAIRPRHEAVMALYDDTDAESFVCLRRAVTWSLSVLACDPQGKQTLEAMLPESGPTGLMRRAMAGFPAIAEFVDTAAGGQQGGMVAASLAVEQVRALATQIPPDDASRYLSVVVASLVRRGRLRSPEVFERSLYFRAFQLMEGTLVQQETVRLQDAGKWLLEKNGGNPVNGFRPSTVARAANELIHLYSSEPVQTHLEDINRNAADVRQRVHFWHNIKLGIGAFGLYLGARNTQEVLVRLSAGDGHVLINSLSLASGTLALGSGAALLGEAGHQYREGLQLTRTKKVEAQIAKRRAEAYGNTAVGLLAAAAAVTAIKEFALAADARTASETVGHAVGGVLQLAAFGVGGLHLLGRLSDQGRSKGAQWIVSRMSSAANGSGAAARTARIGLSGTRLAAGPIGWTLLALEAAYVAVKTWNERNASERKVTDWIARSIWGIGRHRRVYLSDELLVTFNPLQEVTEFYRFFREPVIETDVAVLRTLVATNPVVAARNIVRHGSMAPREARKVTVVLPGWQQQVGKFEVIQYKEVKRLGSEHRLNDPELVHRKGDAGILTYTTDTLAGEIEVKYWPNAFAEPDVMLKVTK